jgi:hypothetical protein
MRDASFILLRTILVLFFFIVGISRHSHRRRWPGYQRLPHDLGGILGIERENDVLSYGWV